MTFDHSDKQVTRRDLLRRTAYSVSGMLLLAQCLPGAEAATPVQSRDNGNPYAPFYVGIQSYSLRHFNTDDMLAKTKELGLQYLEAYPEHFPLTGDPKIIDGYKDKLKASGLHLVCYGVVDFSADEADARKKFDFARAMGIPTLTAYPRPEALPLLDKLTEEYKINIAIHNHGPGDNLYDTEDKLVKALQGRAPRVGSCCDTGHYLRSDVNPVQVVKDIGPRLFDIHLKNVKAGPNGQKEFAELGVPGGLLDTVALFRNLKAMRYKGPIMLEYEEHPEDPMPQIQDCLAATRRFAKTVRDVSLIPDNSK